MCSLPPQLPKAIVIAFTDSRAQAKSTNCLTFINAQLWEEPSVLHSQAQGGAFQDTQQWNRIDVKYNCMCKMKERNQLPASITKESPIST